MLKIINLKFKYKLIKEQRKQQARAIKDSERRIKQIEKTKKQVRNSMQLAQ